MGKFLAPLIQLELIDYYDDMSYYAKVVMEKVYRELAHKILQVDVVGY